MDKQKLNQINYLEEHIPCNVFAIPKYMV